MGGWGGIFSDSTAAGDTVFSLPSAGQGITRSLVSGKERREGRYKVRRPNNGAGEKDGAFGRIPSPRSYEVGGGECKIRRRS